MEKRHSVELGLVDKIDRERGYDGYTGPQPAQNPPPKKNVPLRPPLAKKAEAHKKP